MLEYACKVRKDRAKIHIERKVKKMKVKWNEWQKHEVGCYGNFVTLKALRIIAKDNSYYGIEYIDKDGNKQVLYSHYSEIDIESFR